MLTTFLRLSGKILIIHFSSPMSECQRRLEHLICPPIAEATVERGGNGVHNSRSARPGDWPISTQIVIVDRSMSDSWMVPSILESLLTRSLGDKGELRVRVQEEAERRIAPVSGESLDKAGFRKRQNIKKSYKIIHY